MTKPLNALSVSLCIHFIKFLKTFPQKLKKDTESILDSDIDFMFRRPRIMIICLYSLLPCTLTFNTQKSFMVINLKEHIQVRVNRILSFF